MRPTNPLWYLAAFFLAIGSAMAATAVAASAFDPVRDATVIPITERVDAQGATLAIYTDNLQKDRKVTCWARYGKSDQQRIDIPDKGIDVVAEGDGTRWHLIGLLDEGRDGLRLVCRPGDGRDDSAIYGYATVSGYASAVNNGKGIAYIGVAIAVGLAGWIYWCRRQKRIESRWTAADD